MVDIPTRFHLLTKTSAWNGAGPPTGPASVQHVTVYDAQMVKAMHQMAPVVGGIQRRSAIALWPELQGRTCVPNTHVLLGENLPHDGVSVGEFVAWRAWTVDQGGSLWSGFKDDYVWIEPEKANIEEAGFFAAKTEADAHRQAHDYSGDYVGLRRTACMGMVHLWGEVVEHENGFRAEYAWPVAETLVVVSIDSRLFDEHTRWVERAKRRYKIKEES